MEKEYGSPRTKKMIEEILPINSEFLIKEIINQMGVEEFKNTVEKILSNSNK